MDAALCRMDSIECAKDIDRDRRQCAELGGDQMLPKDSDGAQDNDLGYDNAHDSHLGDLEKICRGRKTCTTTV